MVELEARKGVLASQLETAQDPPPLLHPSMAALYRQKVAELHMALKHESTRDEAFDVLRGLVDEIVLTPGEGGLVIDVRGDLAGILAVASKDRGRPDWDGLMPQFEMVAGAGNHLYRTSLICFFRKDCR